MAKASGTKRRKVLKLAGLEKKGDPAHFINSFAEGVGFFCPKCGRRWPGAKFGSREHYFILEDTCPLTPTLMAEHVKATGKGSYSNRLEYVTLTVELGIREGEDEA